MAHCAEQLHVRSSTRSGLDPRMRMVGIARAHQLRSLIRRGDACSGVVMIIVVICRCYFLGVLIAVGQGRGRTRQGNGAGNQRTNKTKAGRSSHACSIAPCRSEPEIATSRYDSPPPRRDVGSATRSAFILCWVRRILPVAICPPIL
jgi:hypothetical protein